MATTERAGRRARQTSRTTAAIDDLTAGPPRLYDRRAIVEGAASRVRGPGLSEARSDAGRVRPIASAIRRLSSGGTSSRHFEAIDLPQLDLEVEALRAGRAVVEVPR